MFTTEYQLWGVHAAFVFRRVSVDWKTTRKGALGRLKRTWKVGGTKVLRNVCVLPEHYTTSQPRISRLKLVYSVPTIKHIHPYKYIVWILTPWSKLLLEKPCLSTSQETVHLFRNSMVHYHIYESPPLVPIFSHAYLPYFLKIHFAVCYSSVYV